MDNAIRNHLLMLAQERDGHVGSALIGGKRGVPNMTIKDMVALCIKHNIPGYSKLANRAGKTKLAALLIKNGVKVGGRPNPRRVPHPKARKAAKPKAKKAVKGGALKRRGLKRKGLKKANPWIEHVKHIQYKLGIPYRMALKEASKTYRKE